MDFLFDNMGEVHMPETLGTLDLKIAQLEQQLKVLQQQQRLSSAYPTHEAQLALEYLRIQAVLDQSHQRRQEFL